MHGFVVCYTERRREWSDYSFEHENVGIFPTSEEADEMGRRFCQPDRHVFVQEWDGVALVREWMVS